MSTTKNLWGELPLTEVLRTPAVILREQATLLTEMTNGLLEGEVVSWKVESENPFCLRLSIIAPALDGYRFSVLDSYHSILLYPIIVYDKVIDRRFVCENESNFLDVVQHILSSKNVHAAITSLISQSKSELPLGL